MEETTALRIAIALEQIALELATRAAHSPAPLPATDGGVIALGWVCPVHGLRREVPAGVSARTGKAYDAFVVCGSNGCPERPRKAAGPAPVRAIPPSELP